MIRTIRREGLEGDVIIIAIVGLLAVMLVTLIALMMLGVA